MTATSFPDIGKQSWLRNLIWQLTRVILEAQPISQLTCIPSVSYENFEIQNRLSAKFQTKTESLHAESASSQGRAPISTSFSDKKPTEADKTRQRGPARRGTTFTAKGGAEKSLRETLRLTPVQTIEGCPAVEVQAHNSFTLFRAEEGYWRRQTEQAEVKGHK